MLQAYHLQGLSFSIEKIVFLGACLKDLLERPIKKRTIQIVIRGHKSELLVLKFERSAKNAVRRSQGQIKSKYRGFLAINRCAFT